MKQWIQFSSRIIFLTIFLTSCQARTVTTPEIPMLTGPMESELQFNGVSLDLFADITLVSPQTGQTLQLSDGAYIGGDDDGGLVAAGWLPQAAFGDLNSDGKEDAALLFSENMGGSGVFVSLIVMINKDGGFVQADSRLVDDRPLINSLAIENGRIVLDAVIHGINDSKAEPTKKVIETYIVSNESLVLRQYDSTIIETTRMIKIDSPVEGEQVDASLQVKGSMPITAFENNLIYKIFDGSNNVIDQGSFMVIASDMGAPATFDNTLVIPGAVSGARYRIVLEETSMADGSTLCLNSVEVVVK